MLALQCLKELTEAPVGFIALVPALDALGWFLDLVAEKQDMVVFDIKLFTTVIYGRNRVAATVWHHIQRAQFDNPIDSI